MASEWKRAQLGDVIVLKRGYDLPKRSRQNGTIPVVSSSGTTGFHSEAMVSSPGVVTGRYGTLGQVFFMTQPFWPLNTTLYVKDFKGNDPRFVHYFLQTLDFWSCSDKAAVPGLNRNDLHQLPVVVPPLAEQRAISHILGALDDKIELNRRTNETLDSVARALFSSWFVEHVDDRLPNASVEELTKRGILAVGDGYRAKNSEMGEKGLPFVKVSHIDGGIDLRNAETLVDASVERAREKISKALDVVFTSKGTWAFCACRTNDTPLRVFASAVLLAEP